MYPTNRKVKIMNLPSTDAAHTANDNVEDRRSPVRDAGVTTVEILSWSAMLVVAIVIIAGLLQALGVDVINYVRDQIGV